MRKADNAREKRVAKASERNQERGREREGFGEKDEWRDTQGGVRRSRSKMDRNPNKIH